MSKKDYELLAEVIRKVRITSDARMAIAIQLAWALHEHDNIRFNANKFIIECTKEPK